MRIPILISFIIISTLGHAQELNVAYRTATSHLETLHYLIFIDSSTCKLTFPVKNYPDTILFPQKRQFNFKYHIIQDTIAFDVVNQDIVNPVALRILKAKFVVRQGKEIFDTASGYTYVDGRLVENQYLVFAFKGFIYRQLLMSDGEYCFLNIDNLNPKLRKRIKRSKQINLKLTTVAGKQAYDKYGILGMNGVIEISYR